MSGLGQKQDICAAISHVRPDVGLVTGGFVAPHQYASHFQLAASRTLESEKVPNITFSFDPKQSHFEFALRAHDKRLDIGRHRAARRNWKANYCFVSVFIVITPFTFSALNETLSPGFTALKKRPPCT